MKPDQESLIDEARKISLLQSGSEDAVRQLYRQYGQALFGVIFHLVKDRELAEEVLQEAFVKMWQNRASYDRSKGRLYTWMLSITRNLAIDKLRSKDHRNAAQTESIDHNVHNVSASRKEQQDTDHIGLKELVSQLRPEQKELIDLVYFSGYTQAEAAKELKIPLGTVKTRIRSAVMELRKYFSFL